MEPTVVAVGLAVAANLVGIGAAWGSLSARMKNVEGVLKEHGSLLRQLYVPRGGSNGKPDEIAPKR